MTVVEVEVKMFATGDCPSMYPPAMGSEPASRAGLGGRGNGVNHDGLGVRDTHGNLVGRCGERYRALHEWGGWRC